MTTVRPTGFAPPLLLVLAALASTQAFSATPDLDSLQRYRQVQPELRARLDTDARHAHVDGKSRGCRGSECGGD